MGRMGYAMASRLLEAGCEVTVWNRTRGKAEPLAKHGAKVAAKVAELGACDIVFTMVSTTGDLKQVLFDKGGLLSGKKFPKVIVDCSSISDDGSAEVRTRCEELGVGYLCAPVSGNGKVRRPACSG